MGFFDLFKKKAIAEHQEDSELRAITYPGIQMEDWNTTRKAKVGEKVESLLMCYGAVEKTEIRKIVLQLLRKSPTHPDGELITELKEEDAPATIDAKQELMFNLILDVPAKSPKSSAEITYFLKATMELQNETVTDTAIVKIY